MKHLVALALILVSVAPPAFAQTPTRDRELTEALTALQDQITQPGGGGGLARVGVGVALVSFAGIGAVTTLLRMHALPLHEWNVHPGELLNFSVDKLKWGVAAGAAIAWAGGIYAGVKWAQRRGAPVDYHTAEGLTRFFALPIDEQVRIARDDVKFGDFILSLDRTFDSFRLGFDPRRAR